MMAYAGVMIAVYPIGIPATYAYLLFVKHSKELQLLCSLELKRVALREEALAANRLSIARTRVKDAKHSIWTTADLADARGSRRRLSVDVTEVDRLPSDVKHEIDKL